MKLSRELKLMIAKSGADQKWLPLWMHASDTANVISDLIHLRYASLAELCGMSFHDFKKTAVLLAYLHDIGKLTPLFQSRILKTLPKRRSLFEHYGIHSLPEHFPNPEKSHHAKSGEAILLDLNFPKGFSSVVGAHHGMPAQFLLHHIEKYPHHFWGKPKDKELWGGLYREWADFSLEQAGFSAISEIPPLSKKAEILLSALLITADWLSSDSENFELLDEDTLLSEDEYPRSRGRNALQKKGITESWESVQERIFDEDFNARFGFPAMNAMQKDVIKAIQNCTKPGLFLLEAPMGTGKTEAALAALEILAARFDKHGLFFGLPTQATANGIFERVAQWAEQLPHDAVRSIQLAHGNAEFQPVFAKLKHDRMPQTDSDGESGLAVNSFFGGGKMSLLSDFVVATVDRLLMSALKRKHVMLLHLGLAQKVVIVDECHSYDAFMNQYLDTVLAWLHEYQVPVILLSATLPFERRKKLLEAYRNDKANPIRLPDADYPRLTYTDGKEVFAKTLSFQQARQTVKITRGDDALAIEKIKSCINCGACAGIICNTVIRAQYFAEAIRHMTGATVILYHAQYIIPDRIEREEAIKKAVGKKSTAEMRKGVIVVGTQVLEQSLDIDFDLLITELCPMDLLLQRIGRLWRHPRTDRPYKDGTAECVVLGVEELGCASEQIYTEWLLLRTKKLLPTRIILPDDIDPLVHETYCAVEPDGTQETKAWKAYQNLLEEKRRRAEGFLMAEPQADDNASLNDLLCNSAYDNDTGALATVRDGMFSIEVLVLVQRTDGMLKLLPWQANGQTYRADLCPPDEECRQIARQKLRLPARFCYTVDRTIDELEQMDRHLTGFQKSRWLKGQLVLLLDENLGARLCGFELTYRQENGLTYTKEGG